MSTKFIDSLLTLAATEAAAAGFSEITTGHLVIALSKASEMENSGLDLQLAGAIRREFDLLGIDPRRFRRRLRELLGATGVRHDGGLQVSTRCQAVFRRSETLAAQSGVASEPHLLVRAAFTTLMDDRDPPASARQTPDLSLEEIPHEL
jgi:hypothetical protein